MFILANYLPEGKTNLPCGRPAGAIPYISIDSLKNVKNRIILEKEKRAHER
jgi:hypothetical protein